MKNRLIFTDAETRRLLWKKNERAAVSGQRKQKTIRMLFNRNAGLPSSVPGEALKRTLHKGHRAGNARVLSKVKLAKEKHVPVIEGPAKI